MPELVLPKKPIQPLTYYVQCAVCSRVEGRFVQSDNQLTVGTGLWADKFRDERGWRFENGEWICPAC